MKNEKREVLKMKKLVLVLLIAAFVLASFACSSQTAAQQSSEAASSVSESAAAPASDEAASASVAASSADGEKLTITYFAITMSNQWLQNIERALKYLGESNNFEVLTADANFDAATQLSQIDTMISQGIDGAVLFVCDEAGAPAAVEKFTAANIPVIGETLKLQDANGINIAPYVELDAFSSGGKCGTWVAENYKGLGFDFSDLSKVGFIANTKSVFQSDLNRVEGFKDSFFKAFPEFPEENKFLADCAAEANSSDDTEASFNQVSAVLAANPDIETWVIFSSVDDYALGACRAVETAGLVEKTLLTSTGGERAVQEWANGASEEWRATCYYDALDDATMVVDGLMQMIRQSVKAEELWPELREEGQTISVSRFSGNMCTKDDYQQYIKSY